jgi:hypothetical protein
MRILIIFLCGLGFFQKKAVVSSAKQLNESVLALKKYSALTTRIIAVQLAVLTSCILLAGCVSASRSREILPELIPPSNYADLSCQDTTLLLAYKRDEELAVSSRQDTGGYGLLGLIHELEKMSNEDLEREIAKVKGEVNALQAALITNCS